MKILLFIDSLGAGGAQRQLVGLARMLKDNGMQVKVITYHDNPFYLPTLEEGDVDYENVSHFVYFSSGLFSSPHIHS